MQERACIYVCVCVCACVEGGESERVGGGREYYAIKPPTLPFHLFEVSVRKLSIILFY